MMSAIMEGNQTRSPVVIESEGQTFRSIYPEESIPSLGIHSLDTFRLLNIERWISGIGTQKPDRFIDRFSFTQFYTGIFFQVDDFEMAFEGKSSTIIGDYFLFFLSAFEGVEATIPGGVSVLTSLHLTSSDWKYPTIHMLLPYF